MNTLKSDRRRRQQKQQRDIVTSLLAVVAFIAVCVLGWLGVDRLMPVPAEDLPITSQFDQGARRVAFSMCGRDRYTCVVDGDTVWLDGANLRLQSFDTPEPYDDVCGGQAEVSLAKRASARLVELLNSNAFTVETGDTDRYGRTLATIWIGGTDVGDILISEGLARRWPDGYEFWC